MNDSEVKIRITADASNATRGIRSATAATHGLAGAMNGAKTAINGASRAISLFHRALGVIGWVSSIAGMLVAAWKAIRQGTERAREEQVRLNEEAKKLKADRLREYEKAATDAANGVDKFAQSLDEAAKRAEELHDALTESRLADIDLAEARGELSPEAAARQRDEVVSKANRDTLLRRKAAIEEQMAVHGEAMQKATDARDAAQANLDATRERLKNTPGNPQPITREDLYIPVPYGSEYVERFKTKEEKEAFLASRDPKTWQANRKAQLDAAKDAAAKAEADYAAQEKTPPRRWQGFPTNWKSSKPVWAPSERRMRPPRLRRTKPPKPPPPATPPTDTPALPPARTMPRPCKPSSTRPRRRWPTSPTSSARSSTPSTSAARSWKRRPPKKPRPPKTPRSAAKTSTAWRSAPRPPPTPGRASARSPPPPAARRPPSSRSRTRT